MDADIIRANSIIFHHGILSYFIIGDGWQCQMCGRMMDAVDGWVFDAGIYSTTLHGRCIPFADKWQILPFSLPTLALKYKVV